MRIPFTAAELLEEKTCSIDETVRLRSVHFEALLSITPEGTTVGRRLLFREKIGNSQTIFSALSGSERLIEEKAAPTLDSVTDAVVSYSVRSGFLDVQLDRRTNSATRILSMYFGSLAK